MKTEFDKEIDGLLRESARRGRAASGERRPRADDGATAAVHLDADEQSAYAENALPAAARAHYTAHLADCDDCRRGVTRLALAAGMPAQVEQREAASAAGQAVSTQAGWRGRLGALLAPRAWRYAVPALALLLVGAVALVVFKRNPREDATSIARQNTSEAKRGGAAQPETHHAPQNDNAATTTAPGVEGGLTRTTVGDADAANMNAPLAKEDIAANAERSQVMQPSVGTVVGSADAAPPPPAPVVGGGGGGAGARSVPELPTPAPTPAPAVANADAVTVASEPEAKTKSGEAMADLRKLEQRRGGFENRQYENRQREQISGPRRNEQAQNRRAADNDFERNRDDRKDGNLAAATAAPAPAASAPPAAAKRSRPARAMDRGRDENRPAEDSEAATRPKPSAETRTVAGRKFRRQGDAWVDTAYREGQSYTVVRRNSEQFRALAADEPQLRRLADALGGEVTVVWKGRAYRIR